MDGWCNSLKKMRCEFSLLIFSVAQVLGMGAALAQIPPSASITDINQPSDHHADHTSNIRLHRLKHVEAKMNADPQALKQYCRYESEISTPPPHKRIVLTFDDGPEPKQTEFILETLKRHQVHATFFMVGEQVRKHPELVEKVRLAGHHLIANHSWDHPNFHAIDAAAQAQEVEKTEQLIQNDMTRKLFRYPFGNASCETNDLLHKNGYQIVGWHVDSCDWAFDKTGSIDAKEATSCGVLPQYHNDYAGHVASAIRAHNGGIVLMHEIHANTLKKLDEIISTALADGFVFGSIDDADFANSLR